MSDNVIKAENVRVVSRRLPGGTSSFADRRQPEGSGAAGRDETAAGKTEPQDAVEALARAGREAYERGFAEGTAWQKNQSLQAMKTLAEILREAGDLKRKFYAEMEGQMLALILAVAEKVVCDEIAANDRVILAVLREAVKNVVDREGMKIRLNPEDYRQLTDGAGDFLPELKSVKNLSWEEDEGIKRGGAVLETLSGEVDARLEQRLKEVRNALEMKQP